MFDKPIIVACDVSSVSDLKRLINSISNDHCRTKIGKELFTNIGPQAIDICHKAGFDVFLDLKFHDIPTTCAKAVKAAARMGVWMTNVHCAGGLEMMHEAREVLDGESHKPILLGVTVLTSMGQEGLNKIGVSKALSSHVDELSSLAKDAGLDGVVCAATEVQRLSNALGQDFCLVTPGIRPAWATKNDQKLVRTPREATNNGAHYLVIGRPITKADCPQTAIDRIMNELQTNNG